MKYVCFDIGNVLCHVDFANLLSVLSKNMNITLDEAMYFLNRTQKLHDLGLTNLSDELRDHFKIRSPITINEILEEWNKAVIPNDVIFTHLSNIVNTNEVSVALLSNIGLEHAVYLDKKLSQYDLYNKSIKHFSCTVGARKPSLIYYQSFLLKHPEFKGSLYIDDLPENLKASEAFGFKPYQFELDKAEKNKMLECASLISKLILK